ncbi:MAG: hypothetical protein ACRDLN_13215, partial [Solirubrobacteraceae bacterium]
MRIRTTVAALTIIGLLALPAGAFAGGWATVGLSSTPDGLGPGDTWNVELEVLQHGRTPLDDVTPTVTIAAGGDSRTFATRPAGRPGVHRASVTFPSAGTWRYVVDDGFSARHSYPPVRIGGGAAVSGDGGPALDRILLAALTGLAAAACA